jgi:DNA-binding NtrC family response regulator
MLFALAIASSSSLAVVTQKEKGKGQSVLLIDDEADVLNALRKLLKRSLPQINIVTARSGPEALGLLQQGKVDLIVTDYRMPGMDGLEFLQKANEIAPDVPRVMITAFPEPKLASDAANNAKVSLMVTKPFDYEYFVGVIASILDRHAR